MNAMTAVERRRKSGQGMTEYIIIVAIIAVGAILIIGLFGKQIKSSFGKSTSALAGTELGDANDATEGDINDASTKQNDMGTFDDDVTGN